MSEQPRTQFTDVLAAVEPYLFKAIVAVMLVAAGAFGVKYFSGMGSTSNLGGSRVVVFDVVKLANSQRKVASAFMGKDMAAAGEQATLLLDVQQRTRDVIRDIAGPGTLVLVKQAVIHTDLEDITDDVLRELKLPVDVPTQDPGSGGVDYAPTIMGMTPAPQSDESRRGSRAPLSGGQILP